jgi:hypothetical protein
MWGGFQSEGTGKLKSGLDISEKGQPIAIVVEVTSLTHGMPLSSRGFFTEFSRSRIAF